MSEEALAAGAPARERLAIPGLVRPCFWGLLWVLPLFAAEWLFIPLLPSEGAAAALVLAALLAHVFFVHVHERRAVRELRGGLRALVQVALGALVGFVFPLALLTVYLSARLTVFTGFNLWDTFSLTLGALAFSAAIAVFEELVFRGVVLRYLELWLGSWPALALSALAFGAYHYLYGPQPPALLAERVLAGLLLGAAYLLTRRLWASIGLHCAVNVGLALAFGQSDVTALLRLVWESDSYWTSGGGAYLLRLTVVGLLACAAIVAAWRSGGMVTPRRAWTLQIGGPGADSDAIADA
jgi:uncharacterized protein